ncbi:MAG TPA: DUF502 domain-containing protein [Candidatus Eisenbacteria bacterium]|jgi:uncharacterized membrane protein
MNDTNRVPILGRLRNYFLTGLLVLGPLVLTGYVVWRLFFFFDHLLGSTLRGGYIRPGGIPGLGFVTVVLIILVTGVLASNLLGRQVARAVEGALLRVPYLRGLYSTVKQVGEALLSDKRGAFQRVVLVEFPRPGVYAVAFVTAPPSRAVLDADGRPLTAVFIPTPPNPATGPLLFYPEETLIPTHITVEQAVKMVVSAGVATPPAPGARAPEVPMLGPAADFPE